MLRAPEKSEMIAQMKGTFSIQVNFERQGFSEDVAEFASVVTIFAHLDDFTLEQVLQYVEMAVNLFASDLEECDFEQALQPLLDISRRDCTRREGQSAADRSEARARADAEEAAIVLGRELPLPPK